VARALARWVPAHPHGFRSGDFPQRPVVADTDHRQLPSASWQATHSDRINNDSLDPLAPVIPPAKRQEGPDDRLGVGTSNASASSPLRDPGGSPVLVPNVYLDSGRIVEPISERFEVVLDGTGKPVDPFDVADRLAANYQRFCVVDLEGLRRNRAQLEYLQELSRSGEMWVDAGIRTGDQVIDILVTGARRAVLSTAYLIGSKELRRAWRLSPEVLFAVETEGSVVRSRGNDWDRQPASQAIANARSMGVVDVILRSRPSPVDWSLVRQLASQGPLWVADGGESTLRSRLPSAGAVGGFFDSPHDLLVGAPGPQ
jgi:hypothetical protein